MREVVRVKLKTAITGLRSFWMQGGEALSAIGALDYPKEERRRLAKLCVADTRCRTCEVRLADGQVQGLGVSDLRSQEPRATQRHTGASGVRSHRDCQRAGGRSCCAVDHRGRGSARECCSNSIFISGRGPPSTR
jgi:hypothetical protein